MGLVQILQMSRLAARAADRDEDGPIVLAGGVAVRLKPEPLADFLDLALIGDGEPQIPELLRAGARYDPNPSQKPIGSCILPGACRGLTPPRSTRRALNREGRLLSFFTDTRRPAGKNPGRASH